MHKKHHLDFKHILNNKKIIISVLVLGLVIIFVLFLEQEENYKIKKPQGSGFVIGSAENIIQPVHGRPIETVMSEGDFDFNSVCEPYINRVTSTLTTSTDIYSKKTYAPILMYHYIEYPGSSTSPWLFHSTDIFEAQLKTLKKHCYQTFFMRDVAESVLSDKTLPAKNVTLTFDDGYADWYYNVFPLLKKYQVKATMFVIVDAIGTQGYLTKEQMKEMADSGYVEFGSHTLNHINLRESSWKKANWEMSESKRRLEKILDRPVYSFAYPYGFFTERDEVICRNAGYLACASTYPGDSQSFTKRYSLYRLRPGYRVADDLMQWLEQIDHFKLKY